MNPYLALLIPLAVVAILFGVQWRASRRFDRKYPHLTRAGLREAERRTNCDGDGI